MHLTNDGSIYRKFVFLLLANLFKTPTILHFPQFAVADVARAKLPIRLLGSMCRHNVAPFGPADQVSHAAEISAAFDWGEELEPFHGKFPKGYQSHDLVQNHAFEVIGYDASTESFTLHILGVRYPRTRRHSRCRLMSWQKAAAIWLSREGAHPARKRPRAIWKHHLPDRWRRATVRPRICCDLVPAPRPSSPATASWAGPVGIGFSWRCNNPTPFRARKKRWGRSPR